MKSNETLQKEVQDAIKWEPLLNAAEIGVIAKDGIVTLTGTVDSYAKKREAESAAKNVAGVKAVAEKIDIQFGSFGKKDDTTIAKDVVNALVLDWQVPNDKVKVKVENAWVTLEGELEWNYEKEAAKKAVSNVTSVKGVTNNIHITSSILHSIELRDIENALERSWALDSSGIKVKLDGHKVVLNGTVESIYQKEEAGRVAWNAPGVRNVENNLFVDYDYTF
jgi:osmotically-inducible protein OsmY